MEGINSSKLKNELFEAKLKAAEEYIEQAKIELANATAEEDKIIWQNRVNQREESLKEIIDGSKDLAA